MATVILKPAAIKDKEATFTIKRHSHIFILNFCYTVKSIRLPIDIIATSNKLRSIFSWNWKLYPLSSKACLRFLFIRNRPSVSRDQNIFVDTVTNWYKYYVHNLPSKHKKTVIIKQRTQSVIFKTNSIFCSNQCLGLKHNNSFPGQESTPLFS